jgi:RNA polymerase sigma factor (TIGR02999 family)
MQNEVDSTASDSQTDTDLLSAAQAEALVNDACGGSAAARDQLLIALYPQLRGTAARLLQREGRQLTLRPTELLHEAALKLIRLDHMRWQDRAHFMAICCTVMRQVIVDKARHLKAAKRHHVKVTTDWLRDHVAEEAVDVDLLDGALARLAQISDDHARLVELRFFGGLTIEEIAHVTGRSERTVKRQWQSARAWLLQALSEQ